MRGSVWIATLVCAGLWLACSTVKVDSDYDPSTDFSRLRSWTWMPELEGAKSPRVEDGLLDARVRNAIEAQLGAKDLRAAGAGAPDFWVAYHLDVEGKLDVDTISHGYGRAGYRRGGVGYSETRVREYKEGTLLIDLLEPESGALLWRGSGQTRLKEHSSPEARTKNVNAVVAKILEQFPPKP